MLHCLLTCNAKSSILSSLREPSLRAPSIKILNQSVSISLCFMIISCATLTTLHNLFCAFSVELLYQQVLACCTCQLFRNKICLHHVLKPAIVMQKKDNKTVHVCWIGLVTRKIYQISISFWWSGHFLYAGLWILLCMTKSYLWSKAILFGNVKLNN